MKILLFLKYFYICGTEEKEQFLLYNRKENDKS